MVDGICIKCEIEYKYIQQQGLRKQAKFWFNLASDYGKKI